MRNNLIRWIDCRQFQEEIEGQLVQLVRQFFQLLVLLKPLLIFHEVSVLQHCHDGPRFEYVVVRVRNICLVRKQEKI